MKKFSNLRNWKSWHLVLFVCIFSSLVFPISFSNAAVKSGSACPKAGTTAIASGKTFTCINSGKKLVWSQKILNPTQTTSNTVLNIFENSNNFIAFSNVQHDIASNSVNYIPIDVQTGPNTNPYFNDYLTLENKLFRLYSNINHPNSMLIIQYNYLDIQWANDVVKLKTSTTDYQWILNNQNFRGPPAAAQCNSLKQDCRNQQMQVMPSGTALIMYGIPNDLKCCDSTLELRFKNGMGNAHEITHAFQLATFANKNINYPFWPPRWFSEGGAEFFGAASSLENFQTYLEFSKQELSNFPRFSTGTPDLKFLINYLDMANLNPDGTWGKYNDNFAYDLGFFVIEALEAKYGSNKIFNIFKLMSDGNNFESSFKSVTNDSWINQVPIISNSIDNELKLLLQAK